MKYKQHYYFLWNWVDILCGTFITSKTTIFIILDHQEKIINQFVRFSKDEILSKKRGYIQTIVYGIGSCAAKFSTEIFEPHAEVLIKTLLDVIDAPGSRSTANAESTENAISSLFRICIYKSDWKYVTNDYLVKSLKLLPIISEEVEAKSINRLFLKKYKERDPILFGKDDINADLVEDLKDRMKEYITSNPDTDFFTKEDIEYLFTE